MSCLNQDGLHSRVSHDKHYESQLDINKGTKNYDDRKIQKWLCISKKITTNQMRSFSMSAACFVLSVSVTNIGLINISFYIMWYMQTTDCLLLYNHLDYIFRYSMHTMLRSKCMKHLDAYFKSLVHHPLVDSSTQQNFQKRSTSI